MLKHIVLLDEICPGLSVPLNNAEVSHFQVACIGGHDSWDDVSNGDLIMDVNPQVVVVCQRTVSEFKVSASNDFHWCCWSKNPINWDRAPIVCCGAVVPMSMSSSTSSWGWKMVASAGFAVYDCSWWWFCSDWKICYVGISIRCTCVSCRLRLDFCHEKCILVSSGTWPQVWGFLSYESDPIEHIFGMKAFAHYSLWEKYNRMIHVETESYFTWRAFEKIKEISYCSW